MSYDLMVFDPPAPSSDREGFMKWYWTVVSWGEGHDYNDPSQTAPQLREWYKAIKEAFPPMNGPDAVEDDPFDNSRISDYSFAKCAVYVAFAWSQASNARQAMFELAKKFRVGFFDVSADDGQVWMPKSDGSYVCAHGTGVSSG